MALHVIHTIRELNARLLDFRSGRIGLVPTMGALHAGHASLIAQAAAETDCVVVSIFVNPLQFNDLADYHRYPREIHSDSAFCERYGSHIVFAPPPEEMYPQPPATFVDVAGVSEHLCGKFRPGHFRGVATVVLKLLQIVKPDRAYFGEKDAQQLAVIECMVRDLNVPVEIVPVATVREHDGLAMSSRNQLLSPQQRLAAPLLYRSLQQARQRIEGGERDSQSVKNEALAVMADPEIRIEYLEIVDAATIRPVESIQGGVRVAVAAWLGSTRLIDNIFVSAR
jgi:pantoate--beta-alanine ligase